MKDRTVKCPHEQKANHIFQCGGHAGRKLSLVTYKTRIQVPTFDVILGLFNYLKWTRIWRSQFRRPGDRWVSLEQNEVTGLVTVLGLVRSVLGARLAQLVLERRRLGPNMSKVFV